ncbi:transcriptional regulator [Budviciaceae bacterium BWR-B9]|uniref:Transcriptional regulator n=1 Tax=Limnobaculum allomyrinae TaxID=2791986 RepID=A0ABS1IW17_9GAMM|nr:MULTISPECIES: helix-turn-helix transcriptional regulator [Limnobaculum]MBK5145862.1 transcriptional regulator [Limnobaculum allomyrinae]MBV7693872.1 transcriptional regulator [Limnobaculum sp. M2-1]
MQEQGYTPREIVQFLINAGLTQVDIQNKTGISQASISRILTGRSTDLRVSVVTALETLFLEVDSWTENDGRE